VKKFLPVFGPLALVGLLYTILVMFAYQGHRIIHNLGPVFRVIVPMVLYFIIMWFSSFGFIFYLTRRESANKGAKLFGYEMAVVQAFTAGSNNFVSQLATRWTHMLITRFIPSGACHCSRYRRIRSRLQ
jgi:arsenite transporter